MVLAPFLFIWLILLFRMLGSTAEDYFSPSLEMFSTKLGLPPRFAGVSLLALGNGAADVSATINAITTDPKNGYLLSLGALTGSCMFIGAVVASVVIIAADGVPCRGALVRDVSALLITAVLVWITMLSGVIGHGTITLFASFYVIYMVIVLVADIYHRAVVIPRLEAKRNADETARQHQASIRVNEAAGDALNNIASGTEQGGESLENPDQVPSSPTGVFSTFMTALSNYDNTTSPEDQQEGWGVESDDLINERPVVLHGNNGVLSPARRQATSGGEENSEPSGGNYAMLEDGIDNICTESGSPARNWPSAFRDCLSEVQIDLHENWKEIFYDEDSPMYEKALLVFEFPFTVFRKLTVSIPCEGHYSRGTVAASIAISPIWFAFYLWAEREINVFWDPTPYFFIHFAVCALFALLVVRYAPANDGVLNLYIAAPIALYGFIVAATWIDWIADKLVAVLDFFGIVFHIPGPLMGLTILAWGNSMADLSANVTMARKGLANMAMTACYAGPVFNILIGISFGFSSLLVQTGQHEATVVLSPSVRIGFIFMIINTTSLIFTGAFINKGRLSKSYGYGNLVLYAVYIGLSLFATFS
eukprot:CAMPEP_0178894700 /NCGR_PEP_ID=MMETSP0786-20121207/165_1 /TAXON_ID=186022 /ORGANISM="Thalassionema frauenfeldii, Strain CCMP 1798" /LENGTH=592 /DNA_ID=CAMNT_0020564825 /DNA_START=398 /DNA_END=2176 /DNA_ORIENTATION=+